jgi:phosphoserine phosphatase RsbU/P
MAAYDEETITLNPGDWLIVFTDGVSEAMSAAGDEYGEERIVTCVRGEQASATAGAARGAVRRRQGRSRKGAAQSDDITGLVLRYEPRTGG